MIILANSITRNWGEITLGEEYLALKLWIYNSRVTKPCRTALITIGMNGQKDPHRPEVMWHSELIVQIVLDCAVNAWTHSG